MASVKVKFRATQVEDKQGVIYYQLIHNKVVNMSDRLQYKSALFSTNNYLKQIAKRLNLPISLTMYVASHSWASVAKSRNIPISVISEGMGHDSEAIKYNISRWLYRRASRSFNKFTNQ